MLERKAERERDANLCGTVPQRKEFLLHVAREVLQLPQARFPRSLRRGFQCSEKLFLVFNLSL
jgi:hypothetical protein